MARAARYKVPDDIRAKLLAWCQGEYAIDAERRAATIAGYLETLSPREAETLIRCGWYDVDDSAPEHETYDTEDPYDAFADPDDDDDDDEDEDRWEGDDEDED